MAPDNDEPFNDLIREEDLTQNASLDDFEQSGPVPPGKYHAKILKIEAKDSKYFAFTFLILAGKNAEAVDMKHVERLYWSDAAAPRRKGWANRLGLLTENGLGRRVPIDWRNAIDKECVIEIHAEKFKDKNGDEKTSSKVTYLGIWSADDERVRDVPRANEPSGAPKPKPTTPPTKPAPASAPVSATVTATATNDFSDV
jgi:hypothetical protein